MSRILKLKIYLLIVLVFTAHNSQGQDSNACPQEDLPMVVSGWLKKEPKKKDAGASSLLLLPLIDSNPATGFMVGLGGQYAFQLHQSTRYSML